MTKEDARERMDNEGLMHTDAVMLILSSPSEGRSVTISFSRSFASREYVKEMMLKQLEDWRVFDGMPYNLKRFHWLLGVDILREFG